MSADPHKKDPSPEQSQEGKEQDEPKNTNQDSGKVQQGPETKDEKADEWGEESFPGSDAPANY